MSKLSFHLVVWLMICAVLVADPPALAAEKAEIVLTTGHYDRVHVVAFSPDGMRLASGSGDGVVKLWDVASGRLLKTLEGHSDGVYTIAFSTNGKRLATGGADGTIRLWDLTTGRSYRTLTVHSNYITSLAFSPDARHIASGSGDGVVKLWDAASGRLLRTLEGHSGGVYTVAFSPDGARLASGGSGDKATVRLWSVRSGRLLRIFEGLSGGLHSILFDVNGQRIVAAGVGAIKIWNVTKGQLLNEFVTSDQNWVESLVFGQDRRLRTAAVGGTKTCMTSDDCRIVVLDVARGQSVMSLESVGPIATITDVKLSPDGTRVASANLGSTIKLWDARSGQLIRTLEGSNYSKVIFSPDRTQLATYEFRDRTVLLWDARNGQVRATLRGLGVVCAVAFSPAGTRLATLSTDGTVSLRDLASRQVIEKIQAAKSEVGYSCDIEFSPNGTRLVTNNYYLQGKKILKIWDVSSGRLLRTLEEKSNNWSSAVFSPDDRRLVTIGGGQSRSIRLWDVASGRLLRTLEEKSDNRSSVVFSPNGSGLVISSRGKTAKLWHGISGRPIQTLIGNIPWPQFKFPFSPDGSRIVSFLPDGRAMIWDVAKGKILRTIQGHSGPIIDAAFSPDGRRLATRSKDETVELLDVASGRLLSKTKTHQNSYQKFSFSPDGRWFAVSDRKRIRLWDMANGHVHQTIVTNSYYNYSPVLAFSSDGRRLVTSGGGATRLWDVFTGQSIGVADDNLSLTWPPDFLSDGTRLLINTSYGVQIVDVETAQRLMRLIPGRNGAWLAVTPEGFFSGSLKGAEMLSIVRGLEVFGIDRVYDALYRPDLVMEKLAGDPKGLVREAAAKLNLDKVVASGAAPQISIISPRDGGRVRNEQVVIEAKITNKGGGVGRIEWRVNGITLGLDERGLARIGAQSSTQAGKTTRVSRKLFLESGKNTIEVVAYNARNLIASDPARVTVRWDGATSKTPPRLHILAIGVNDYWDSRLRLNYAASDARAIAGSLQQAGKGLYREVNVVTLLDKEVTTARLDKAFTMFGRKVRPRDVFVFFLAGHGKTVDGRYYFIPQDFRYEDERSIVRSGIGQDLWQKWLARIPARKSVLLYDTCESGSLTGERLPMRGLERVAALERLTRAMGRTVLSASTDDSPALEGYEGHGVFTYTLLEAFGRADGNGNGTIELTELAGHVDARVPELSYKAFGFRQVPQMKIVGSNFPLVKQTASVAPKTHGVVVPLVSRKPTHVLVKPADLFPEPGGKGVVLTTLEAGTSLTLVRTEAGWVLVAKNGKKLGYVVQGSLAPLQ